MHLECPHCDHVVNIGNVGRFAVFFCRNCKKGFRGIHAEIPRIRMVFDWINPFSQDDPTNWDSAPCPFCAAAIDLQYSKTKKGFNAPTHCRFCRNELPSYRYKGDELE